MSGMTALSTSQYLFHSSYCCTNRWWSGSCNRDDSHRDSTATVPQSHLGSLPLPPDFLNTELKEEQNFTFNCFNTIKTSFNNIFKPSGYFSLLSYFPYKLQSVSWGNNKELLLWPPLRWVPFSFNTESSKSVTMWQRTTTIFFITSFIAINLLLDQDFQVFLFVFKFRYKQ